MTSVSVLIVGAGFAGIGMARTLLRAGITDIVVLERAASVGGTWRDNVYPGVACDVPTPLYSYSFAPNPEWTRLYAPQWELRRYLEACTDHFGVRPLIRFGVDVQSADFDEPSGRWTVHTSAGVYTCQALISASGHALSRPVLPDIDGMGSFRGPTMHSARWDAAIPLNARRIGLIGTGASAVQIAPELAKVARELRVFQRTPAWVLPRIEASFGPRARAVFRRAPIVQKLLRGAIYGVLEALATGHVVEPRLHALVTERISWWHMKRQVADPALRERLRPSFRLGCKRMLISNDYLPTLCRPNVTLVTSPITRITTDGVETADGVHHDLDVLIFATGYEAADAGPPFAITGRAGVRLADAWAGGPEAYLGTAIAGFPNLFMVVGPNTGQGHTSMVYMMESQFPYIAAAITALRRKRLAWLDVRPDIQARYNRWLQARLKRTVWNRGGCQSWYLSRSGKNTTTWPGYTFEFRARLRRFRLADFHASALEKR